MASSKKTNTVVVLGGGYYGNAVAKQLAKNANNKVVLVDQREVMIHKMGLLRGTVAGHVDPVWIDRILLSRSNIFKGMPAKESMVKFGKVTKVSDSELQFADDSKMPFDALVVATGAMNTGREAPYQLTTAKEISEYYLQSAKKIASAKNILIVGGGAVGIELSGEIKSLYQEQKNVTLLTMGTLLSNATPALPASFPKKVADALRKKGVTVLENTKIAEPSLDFSSAEHGMIAGDFSVKTNTGNTLKADLIIIAAGASAKENESIFPSSWLAEVGQKRLLHVDENLRVVGTKNVFAVGDCTDIAETKLGALADMHASVAKQNVEAVLANKTPKARYSPLSMKFAVLPLGFDGGVSYVVFTSVGSWMTRKLKSKDLFATPTSAGIGATIPPFRANWLNDARAKALTIG